MINRKRRNAGSGSGSHGRRAHQRVGASETSTTIAAGHNTGRAITASSPFVHPDPMDTMVASNPLSRGSTDADVASDASPADRRRADQRAVGTQSGGDDASAPREVEHTDLVDLTLG